MTDDRPGAAAGFEARLRRVQVILPLDDAMVVYALAEAEAIRRSESYAALAALRFAIEVAREVGPK